MAVAGFEPARRVYVVTSQHPVRAGSLRSTHGLGATQSRGDLVSTNSTTLPLCSFTLFLPSRQYPLGQLRVPIHKCRPALIMILSMVQETQLQLVVAIIHAAGSHAHDMVLMVCKPEAPVYFALSHESTLSHANIMWPPSPIVKGFLYINTPFV